MSDSTVKYWSPIQKKMWFNKKNPHSDQREVTQFGSHAMCACVCSSMCAHVCLNLFASVLIVPIWSEQSCFRALPCPPYSSIYHRKQWRHTKALGASRWIPSNGSACVTLLNRCARWQPAATEISPGQMIVCTSLRHRRAEEVEKMLISVS